MSTSTLGTRRTDIVVCVRFLLLLFVRANVVFHHYYLHVMRLRISTRCSRTYLRCRLCAGECVRAECVWRGLLYVRHILRHSVAFGIRAHTSDDMMCEIGIFITVRCCCFCDDGDDSTRTHTYGLRPQPNDCQAAIRAIVARRRRRRRRRTTCLGIVVLHVRIIQMYALTHTITYTYGDAQFAHFHLYLYIYLRHVLLCNST